MININCKQILSCFFTHQILSNCKLEENAWSLNFDIYTELTINLCNDKTVKSITLLTRPLPYKPWHIY